MPDPSSLASLTFYEPHELDACNFVETLEDNEEPEGSELPCGQTAVACFITTDAQGHGVLLKLCRAHVSRLAITLVQQLEGPKP
jgi:hypothetical protein